MMAVFEIKLRCVSMTALGSPEVPDVNTNEKVMAWMLDEYIKLTGNNTLATFTGQALGFGILFVGMNFMKAAAAPVSEMPQVHDAMLYLSNRSSRRLHKVHTYE